MEENTRERTNLNFLNQDYWKTDEQGLYISSESVASTALSDEQQEDLWNLEDESWWFQYRAEVITGLMDRFLIETKQRLISVAETDIPLRLHQKRDMILH